MPTHCYNVLWQQEHWKLWLSNIRSFKILFTEQRSRVMRIFSCSSQSKRKEKSRKEVWEKEGGGEWAEPMGLMPCSISPEDSPGKIILASQGLKRVQAEVKIKQNPKANSSLKENNDFSFHNYHCKADYPFKFCAILRDLKVNLKHLNHRGGPEQIYQDPSWGCSVVSQRPMFPAEGPQLCNHVLCWE